MAKVKRVPVALTLEQKTYLSSDEARAYVSRPTMAAFYCWAYRKHRAGLLAKCNDGYYLRKDLDRAMGRDQGGVLAFSNRASA